MSKLKSVLKSKKFWIILIIIILLFLTFIIFQVDGEEIESIKNPYEVWVGDGEDVELIIRFWEEYDECSNFSGTHICSDKTLKIYELEILHSNLSDALSEYPIGDNTTISEVIIAFLDYAFTKNAIEEDIQIISDYKFDTDFENTIKEHFNDVNIEFSYGGLSYTGDPQDSYLYYTITFDTKGGSPIDSIVVADNTTIEKPSDPTKEGYTFEYWELDGEEYDFTTPVTEEMTLTAIWKENKNSSNNNSSNNTSNNSSNNTNNNTTSSSKINLNNNISITEYHVNDGTMDCFYYMFVTNLKEVFPNADITKINNNPSEVDFWHTSDRQDYEVSTEEINEYLNNGTLKINTSAENNFKNVLNKYKNGNYKGIASVNYTEENHRFSFSFDYISFNGLNVSSNGEAANKEIQNVLSSSTKFNGPCGSASHYENKTLTEELCNKYNLDCDRW